MGTERVAVLALGEQTGGTPPGLAGWHSAQELAYIGWLSAIAAGCIVKAEGSSVRPTRQRFRAGWVEAADLVEEATIVSTHFTQPVRTIAIIIDDPTETDAARGLSLALEGADRPVGTDGAPVPPTVVVVANRSVLIYPIVPRRGPGALGGPVTVSVASQTGWHLSGVMAGMETPEVMARRMSEHGLDAMLQSVVRGRAGAVSLGWAGIAAKSEKPEAKAAKKAPRKSAKTEAKPAKKSAQKGAKKSTQRSVKKSAQRSAKKSARKSVKKPAQKSARKRSS
jgi:hypothetical protein